MSSWISKLKKKLTGKETAAEEASTEKAASPPATEAPAHEKAAPTPPPTARTGPIEARPSVSGDPVESFIQRLEAILSDPEVMEPTKSIKPTCIQLIVGGTPVMLSKEGVRPLTLSRQRSLQADVFIRMSEAAAGKLAATTTLNEFSELYHSMASARGTPYYVNITLQVDLDELRRRGYFSVGLLRTLIDA